MTDPEHIEEPGTFGFERKEGLSEKPDRGDLAPDVASRLEKFPDKKVIYVGYVDAAEEEDASQPRSVLEALKKIMRVDRVENIGKNGFGTAALDTSGEGGEKLKALFDSKFGRDGLWISLQLAEEFPQLLKTTVYELAELQGTRWNTPNEEEPGRIIQWAPDPESEIAQEITRVNGWEWPHYGAVDTTPMFIRGVLKAAEKDPEFLDTKFTGRDNKEKTINDALHASEAWLNRRLNSNPEGLLEFQMKQERGFWNQAWKDQPESYVHADGSYPNHEQGIASVEIQGLAYDTLKDLAEFYIDSDPDKAKGYIKRAENLKQAILDNFWVEDDWGAYLALGTDRDETGKLRPMEVRTSNMGWVLHLFEDGNPEEVRKREAIIKTLFSDEMLDRNGVRTLSAREKAFLPQGYHTGSIWLFDNAQISRELERTGYPALAHEIDKRIVRVAETTGLYPEYISGDNAETADDMMTSREVHLYDGKREHFSNSAQIERPPQDMQAWSAVAVYLAKHRYQPTPGTLGPLEASDSRKRQFEKQILERLKA